MLPRYANPHFLPQSTSIISRAEIYADDSHDAQSTQKEDPAVIEALNRLIEQSLPIVRHEPPSRPSPVPINKPVAIQSGIPDEKEHEELVLFRLVSSSLSPIPLCLLPPPPPPSKTREPHAEDTEEQALLRKQYTEAASIEGAQVLRESEMLKASPSARQPIKLHASIGNPEPCMMILRTLQPPRKTRPPLPSFQTLQYPYINDASELPTQPSSSKIPGCLTTDARFSQPEEPKRRSRRRRKPEVLAHKERPPSQFWRPSPNLKGKCRGYAYGYPSSLPTEYLGTWNYRRDTMKKAVPLDNSMGSSFRYK